MKKYLYFLTFVTLLASCSNAQATSNSVNPTTQGTITSTTTTTNPSIVTTSSTSESTTRVGPTGADRHLTKLSINPSKDFMVSVGETIKFTPSYEGSPTNPDEKNVTWTVSDNKLATISLISETHNANITFNDVGTVTVTVTSDYNVDLHDSVKVTISDSDYLWNCSKDDKEFFRKKVGSDYVGLASGIANLGGLEWEFERNKPSNSVTGAQNIKFGKEGDNEGEIKLTLRNDKVVKKVVVSCSSKANIIGKDPKTGYDISDDFGSSKLTVTVGSTVYLNEGKMAKGTSPSQIDTGVQVSNVSGDIVLLFSESLTYIALQSIAIDFGN